MKKVLLHYPDWKNRWEPYVKEALSEFDLTVTSSLEVDELEQLSKDADILVSMWANQVVQLWTERFPEKKIITYLRRYEMWSPELMQSIDWRQTDAVVFVSRWCMETASMMLSDHGLPVPGNQIVIPNGIDIDQVPFRESPAKTKKIGMVCSIKEVKNIPMAFQVLLQLPEDYHLHHIGLPYSSQGICTIMSYIDSIGLTDRVHFEGTVKRSEVFDWLNDKEVLLSTSLNEGNPNNVIEAMGMGIKPVIHAWPGARDQFPKDCVFDRVEGAVNMITGDYYDPNFYRQWVMDRYTTSNFKKLTELVRNI